MLAAVAVMLKVGGVGFVCESCPMLGFVHDKKNTSRFSQVMGVYSVFVGFVSQLCSFFKCVCVERGHTWVYTKLTSRLHHARHSCSIFTVLWCGCSFVNSPSTFTITPILVLASMD